MMYDDCGLDKAAQPFALFYTRSDQYRHLPLSVISAIGVNRDDDLAARG